jgi:hypothetical protein
VLHVAALCCIVLHMATRLTLSLSEGLAARVRERSVLEERSVSAMLERLVRLGLGTVVSERDQGNGRRMAAEGSSLGPSAQSDGSTGTSVVAPVVSPRSVAAGFDAAPAAAVREFKPDFKVGTKL